MSPDAIRVLLERFDAYVDELAAIGHDTIGLPQWARRVLEAAAAGTAVDARQLRIASDAARELADHLGSELLAALGEPTTEAQRRRFEADLEKCPSDSEDT